MLKVKNKNYVASPFDHPKKAQLLSFMNSAPNDKESFSFDEIRAAVGQDDKQLPDGAIHQILLDNGFEIE